MGYLDDLAAGDEQDTTNELLAVIAAALTDESTSYYSDGYEPKAPGESDDGQQSPTYASREGLETTGTPKAEKWGFTADTVVIRNLSDEIAIAFKDPNQYDDAVITLTASDSPFVLSGVYGIATSQMYHQTGPNAAGSHTFDLLAVKRRGR